MDKTQFIRDARDENPDATYAEVNKAWKKACEEKGYQSPTGPNIGPIAWRRVAIGYTNGKPQTNKVEWRPSPLGGGAVVTEYDGKTFLLMVDQARPGEWSLYFVAGKLFVRVGLWESSPRAPTAKAAKVILDEGLFAENPGNHRIK